MERRQVLKLVALTALSQKLQAMPEAVVVHMQQTARGAEPYTLRFFTEKENRLLDELMEIIIPADDHSPGAHEAATSLIADLLVSTSGDATKKQWRDGLRAIGDEAEKSSLQEALKSASAHEEDPKTESEQFFAVLKAMTVDAYYTSEIGIHKDLAYAGNKYLGSFPGCTHPEHQTG